MGKTSLHCGRNNSESQPYKRISPSGGPNALSERHHDPPTIATRLKGHRTNTIRYWGIRCHKTMLLVPCQLLFDGASSLSRSGSALCYCDWLHVPGGKTRRCRRRVPASKIIALVCTRVSNLLHPCSVQRTPLNSSQNVLDCVP